jgi:hypothetical protein
MLQCSRAAGKPAAARRALSTSAPIERNRQLADLKFSGQDWDFSEVAQADVMARRSPEVGTNLPFSVRSKFVSYERFICRAAAPAGPTNVDPLRNILPHCKTRGPREG